MKTGISERLGLRHKTIAQWARQMIRVVRRWLPHVAITVLGDQAQGNRISSCPCQYLQQVPFIETAKESFLPDAEGSGAFLS